MSEKQKNVLGEDLEECSNDPLTGWFRDGCCNTDENDHGLHTVCAKVTTECLEWMKEAGNDLITPHPEFGFPGLKDGDGWCLCASWYARAIEAGKGCPIFLKRTHENTLKYVPIETLKKTIETKEAYYYSRSRKAIWHKGKTSGFTQKVIEIRIDDDQDSIWLTVDIGDGASCHVGYRSCFYRSIPMGPIDNGRKVEMEFLEKEKKFDPEEVYKGQPNPTKI